MTIGRKAEVMIDDESGYLFDPADNEDLTISGITKAVLQHYLSAPIMTPDPEMQRLLGQLDKIDLPPRRKPRN